MTILTRCVHIKINLILPSIFLLLHELNKILFVRKPLIIIFVILLIDQLIKIFVKTHFFLGEEVRVVGDWFIIHFTENNGMAYGIEFGGNFGKLFLSIFRIVFVIGIAWYLWKLTKTNGDKLYITCIALIFSGAQVLPKQWMGSPMRFRRGK